MIGRRRPAGRGGGAAPRRSGPPDEVPWWVPADQAAAEVALLERRSLGRRWLDVPMVNNAEQLDPFPDAPATRAVLDARAARVLTGLDEGRAWRRSKPTVLIVSRTEVFADADPGAAAAHRAAWEAEGPACLEATWRARWAERDHPGGWVEARRPEGGAPAWPSGNPDAADVDLIAVQDHTDPTGAGRVTTYAYLTIWAGRLLATLTVRHDLDDADDELLPLVVACAARRLPRLDRDA